MFKSYVGPKIIQPRLHRHQPIPGSTTPNTPSTHSSKFCLSPVQIIFFFGLFIVWKENNEPMEVNQSENDNGRQ